MNKNFDVTLEYPYGNAICEAYWKAEPQDFQVNENLDLEFTGSGEFLWIYVLKKNINTESLAKEIAKAARISSDKISWSGLKDKKSWAKQWFCLHIGGLVDREKWLEILNRTQQESWLILEGHAHQKKLRIGTHQSNTFDLKIEIPEGVSHQEAIEARLKQISTLGFPNYFGYQRFGKNYSNLNNAQKLFDGQQIKNKHIRGLVLSAARSWLFNLQVHERIQQQSFDKIISGDVFQFQNSGALFTEENEETQTQFDQLQIHPTAVLMGLGKNLSSDKSYALEQKIEDLFPLWVRRLKDFKIGQERRSIRVLPQKMSWECLSPTHLRLKFELPKGSFASELLSTCFKLSEV